MSETQTETKERSIRQWIADYDAGKFSAPDFETQCDAGWYDWFCRESSLAGKTKKLAPKVKQVAKSAKVNVDTMYVFFKNNCPVYGKLYDDFRICDVATGKVIYTVVPASGFEKNKGQAEVWGRENEFSGPLVAGDWKDILKFFEV